ncbi:MAG TPA: TetR/AcrR family transcriptional regulator [Acidimicrobiales bacterium]|nr:TetR/AcrR family transcriptional regulator [Acidimicrobiales bacterium]
MSKMSTPSSSHSGGPRSSAKAATRPVAACRQTPRPASAKERLLNAAAELLAQRPPSAVATRDIAMMAGVQQSLIFRHFGSKEQLVREVAVRYALGYREAVQAAGDDPLAGFHQAVDYMLSTKGRATMFALTFIADEAPGTWPESRPGLEAHVTQIRQARGAGQTLAGARDPWLVSAFALALMAGWSFLESWALVGGNLADADVEEVRLQFHEVVENLVRTEAGLRPGSGQRNARRRRGT